MTCERDSRDAAVVRNEDGHTRRIGARGLEIIEEMAQSGHSLTTIAKRLRIDRHTLAKMKARQPEVEEAIERGYAHMEDVLVNRLYETAMGASKGAVTAAIFLLKTRRGYEGTKVPTHITINNDNRQQALVLPSADDMDAYMKRIRDGEAQPVPTLGSEDA